MTKILVIEDETLLRNEVIEWLTMEGYEVIGAADGIPDADQASLFNAFQRASNVGRISGTGLGLAIVQQGVDLHGGTVHLESQIGVGTTFTVRIPI